MRYLSLFAGIEAASCAWRGLDFMPVAFSEIEPFPCNVLSKHYPNVPNLGDITKITPERLNSLGEIDLIVGGSPCQGFSVAGKKKGLNDVRSRLALEYLRVIGEVSPRWILWENVPGALSTNGGMDFRKFVFEITKLGYSVAWRVLDAQFFGVPQRRRRLFLVGCFGEGGKRAADVLFEQNCLFGDFKTGIEEKENTPASTGVDAKDTRRCVFNISHRQDAVRVSYVCPTITHQYGTGGNNVPCVYVEGSYSQYSEKEIAGTLRAAGGAAGGGSENFCLDMNYRLRKLTVVECLRLQGFPDDWLDGVPKYSNTAAYKAIGNSMAVPVMRWIGKRLLKVNEEGNYL